MCHSLASYLPPKNLYQKRICPLTLVIYPHNAVFTKFYKPLNHAPNFFPNK